MEVQKNKPLIIVFVAMIVLALLFFGGAISVTMDDVGSMGSGWRSGISWMWIPAVLFLVLSILLGRVIFAKNKITGK